MSKFNPFNSTIFNKVVMAVTGFILVGFVIVHALGNLQVFAGREVFNAYAQLLHASAELIWLARIILLVSVLLHIITSLRLKFLNLAAKPQGYSKKGYIKSTIYSRTMIYSGLFISFFVLYHLLHFTAHVTNPRFAVMTELYGPKLQTSATIETEDGVLEVDAGNGIFARHDAFQMVIAGFSDPVVSVIYILAVLFLALHLSHAIQSMFQTLGWNGPRLTPILVLTSKIIGWGLFVAFSSIPVGIMIFGYGKGVLGL